MELIAHVVDLQINLFDEVLFYHCFLRDYCLIGIPHITLKFFQLSEARAYFSFRMITMLIEKTLSASKILGAGLIKANKFYFIQNMRMMRTRFVIIGFQIFYQSLQCSLRLLFGFLPCCLSNRLVVIQLSFARVRSCTLSRSPWIRLIR